MTAGGAGARAGSSANKRERRESPDEPKRIHGKFLFVPADYLGREWSAEVGARKQFVVGTETNISASYLSYFTPAVSILQLPEVSACARMRARAAELKSADRRKS